MRRSIVAVALLGLAACGSGSDIGGGVQTKLESPPPTDSPTPKPTKTTQEPKATATPKQTEAPSQPVENYDLIVRTPGEGFDPDSIRLIQGDTITFLNKDPNNERQLVIHEQGSDTEVFVGKVLKPGEKQKFKVDLEAGRYAYKDGAVPYVIGGVLEVLRVA